VTQLLLASDIHTTIVRLFGFCPGQPGWAGIRRNIYPLALIVVTNHPYLQAVIVYFDTERW